MENKFKGDALYATVEYKASPFLRELVNMNLEITNIGLIKLSLKKCCIIEQFQHFSSVFLQFLIVFFVHKTLLNNR